MGEEPDEESEEEEYEEEDEELVDTAAVTKVRQLLSVDLVKADIAAEAKQTIFDETKMQDIKPGLDVAVNEAKPQLSEEVHVPPVTPEKKVVKKKVTKKKPRVELFEEIDVRVCLIFHRLNVLIDFSFSN